MKRTIARLSTAAILSLTCFGITHWWYKSTQHAQNDHGEQKPVAYVDRTRDEIHRRPVTRLLWQLVTDGEALYPGEAVRTSSLGEVRIQFAEGQRFLDLEPDSLIVISQNKNDISLDLMDGSFTVKSSGTEIAGGPSLSLNSQNGKVDLSAASASLSKSKNGIDLQILEGKATIDHNGQKQELGTGATGALGAKGLNSNKNNIKIISPSIEKASFVNPEALQALSFKWDGFPKSSLVQLKLGSTRKDLKDIGESSSSVLNHKLSPGKYFWKLVAVDPASKSAIQESPLYRLEVIARLAPHLIEPNAKTALNLKLNQTETSVDFKWSKPDHSRSISLEIWKDATLKNKIFSRAFLKDEAFQQSLPAGKYFARLSANFDDSERPASTAILPFEVKNFEKPKPAVVVSWKNLEDKSPQYFVGQALAELNWFSEQKDQVKTWRLVLAENEEDLGTLHSQKFETTATQTKAPVKKPGRYIAMVEALDSQNNVLAKSPTRAIDILPKPLLAAPDFLPKDGNLQADNNGKLNLQWSAIAGAKEYQLTLFDRSGKELRVSKFAKTQTSLSNLLPGTYKVVVVAIDEHGRLGEKENPRAVQVPDTSGLNAPKLKKIKVN